MKIQILVDNPKSWYNEYVGSLIDDLNVLGIEAVLRRKAVDIEEGELAFLLSCNRLVPEEVLARNKHNLVVHAAPVPKGRGWSPTTWQILEGAERIPVSLFEAKADVDSGAVFARSHFDLDGTELIDEWQAKLGRKVNEMVLDFVKRYPDVKGEPQSGEASHYPRRRPEDSELDVDKTIAEQFNILRVVDNEQYPAYFRHRGCKYVLTVRKGEP